jgi:hypothetical protein
MKRLTLSLGLILVISLLGSYAFAQRECGPNSTKCQLHHESCTC